MEALFAKNTSEQDSLKGILIPRKEGRNLFLSTFVHEQKTLLSLYYVTGGGTQRVKLFNQKTESDDLTFERLTYPDDTFGVRISPKTMSK